MLVLIFCLSIIKVSVHRSVETLKPHNPYTQSKYIGDVTVVNKYP